MKAYNCFFDIFFHFIVIEIIAYHNLCLNAPNLLLIHFNVEYCERVSIHIFWALGCNVGNTLFYQHDMPIASIYLRDVNSKKKKKN